MVDRLAREFVVDSGEHAVIHVLDPEIPDQICPDFRGEIINCITDPAVNDVEVDLDFCIPTAEMLGALVKAKHRAEAVEKELTISHLSKDGRLILEATGLTDFFNLQ